MLRYNQQFQEIWLQEANCKYIIINQPNKKHGRVKELPHSASLYVPGRAFLCQIHPSQGWLHVLVDPSPIQAQILSKMPDHKQKKKVNTFISVGKTKPNQL